MNLLLLLAACSGNDPVECSEDKACPLGSVCVDGTCAEQSCATSAQCGIEQYCAPDRTCQPGCAEDTDCLYGDRCDTQAGTCVAAECSNTNVDCGFKEFCSPAGECYEATGYYCRDCEEDADCGGGGNLCYGGYCAVDCTTREDCPSGFDCIGFADSLTGNIIGYGCYAACWLFDE